MFTTPGCVNIFQFVVVTFLRVYLTVRVILNIVVCKPIASLW